MKAFAIKLPKYDIYRQWIAEAAEQNRITVSQLTGKDRAWALTFIRSGLAKRMRAAGLSLSEIGLLMNRDHTSIMNYLGQLTKKGRYKKKCDKCIKKVLDDENKEEKSGKNTGTKRD